MNQLFRQAALDKLSNPDQLDQAPRIIQPSYTLGLAVIAAVMLGGLIWSVIATAPQKVMGEGVLLARGGIAEVQAPGSGAIERLLIHVGDTVAKGQAVALIARPDLLGGVQTLETRLKGAIDKVALLKELAAADRHLRDRLDTEKREALNARAGTLKIQRRNLKALLANEEALEKQGFLPQMRIDDTRANIAKLNNELDTLGNDLVAIEVARNTDASQHRQQITDAELDVTNLRRQLENQREQYQLGRTAIAPAAGTVAEVSVNPGDMVQVGAPIARLLSKDRRQGRLSAIVFVPDTAGKEVKVGMAAEIIPSTVKVAKEGFITGRVSRVAELPATRDGMMRQLKNAVLVDQLLRAGPPFEVDIALSRADTPSGYHWSSGQGPTIALSPGTITQGQVVVKRTRIIVLALPAFNYLIRWLNSL